MNHHDTSTSHNHDSWQRRPAQPANNIRQVAPNQVDTVNNRNHDNHHVSSGLGQEKKDGVLSIAAVENPDISNV